MLPFGNLLNKFAVFALGKADKIAFEFALNLRLALGDILFTTFFLKPLPDFAARLTCFDYIQPVAARPLALL